MTYKCHCGKKHEIDVSKPVWMEFFKVTRDLPVDVPVTVGPGTWLVPRMYIAIHGITGKELSLLGFPQIAAI